MLDSPGDVAIIGDDVKSDLGSGAIALGLHRYLGKNVAKKNEHI